MPNKQNIIPFLWFDKNAEEAVRFYTSTFKKSKILILNRYNDAAAQASGQPKGSVMTVAFKLEGQDFVAINGGPQFSFTPAISFFVCCKTRQEVDTLWEKLSSAGSVRMELGKYPWSERYGWVQDKFGVDWQLMIGKATQKITPCLLFVGERFKTAEKAIKLYKSVFKNTKMLLLQKYGKNEAHTGAIKHARFTLNGTQFVIMDGPGPHQFTFSGAISFVINCTLQKEIDHYWNKLSKGGQAMPCGWLQDKFGIVWQVVPSNIDKLLSDRQHGAKVWQEMLKMSKIEIKKLEKAAKG